MPLGRYRGAEILVFKVLRLMCRNSTMLIIIKRIPVVQCPVDDDEVCWLVRYDRSGSRSIFSE